MLSVDQNLFNYNVDCLTVLNITINSLKGVKLHFSFSKKY